MISASFFDHTNLYFYILFRVTFTFKAERWDFAVKHVAILTFHSKISPKKIMNVNDYVSSGFHFFKVGETGDTFLGRII